MKATTIILILMLTLAGCQKRMAVKIESPSGITNEYSEAAFAQREISAATTEKYKSITQCVVNCKVGLADLAEMGQVAAIVAEAAGRPLDYCGCRAQASMTPGGRNYFDAQTERTEARVSGVVSGTRTVGRVATGAIIADAVSDVADSIATNAGDRYAVNNQISTSNDTASGSTTSSDGVDGIPAPNEGFAGTTGTGGSSGSASSQDGASNIIINVGPGNVGVGSDQAEVIAGDRGIMNGDSSVVSQVEDSEVKGSDTGETIEKNDDNSQFDDRDGQQETKLF